MCVLLISMELSEVFLGRTCENPSLLLESCSWTEVSGVLLLLFLRQAECIRMGTGTHACVCQPGWTGDGRDCSAINNCLLPSAGSCHGNATCLYVGPGQVGVARQRATRGRMPALAFYPARHKSTLARTYCSSFVICSSDNRLLSQCT